MVPDALMDAPFGNIWRFLMAYFLYLQYILHLAVALNRYTVFSDPLRHSKVGMNPI